MLQYKNFKCNKNGLFEFWYFSMYSIIAYSADWGVVTNSTAATVQVSTAAGTREYASLLQVLNWIQDYSQILLCGSVFQTFKVFFTFKRS